MTSFQKNWRASKEVQRSRPNSVPSISSWAAVPNVRKASKRGEIKKLGSGLEKARRIIEKHGLRAHYHPHLSTIVEGPKEVRAVFKETGMDFCPDTAHLAAAGGHVPVMIREHAKRISYVHLKGFQENPFAFTPLDAGTLDMNAITAGDARHWFLGVGHSGTR